VLDTVLDNVRWENMLMLHSWVAIYEVRNSRGFGLRWTLNLEDTTPPPSDLYPAATAMTEDKVVPGAGADADATRTATSGRIFDTVLAETPARARSSTEL